MPLAAPEWEQLTEAQKEHSHEVQLDLVRAQIERARTETAQINANGELDRWLRGIHGIGAIVIAVVFVIHLHNQPGIAIGQTDLFKILGGSGVVGVGIWKARSNRTASKQVSTSALCRSSSNGGLP